MPKSDSQNQTGTNNNSYSNSGLGSPPPTSNRSGEADKYLNKITTLLDQDKLRIFKTNLDEFSIPSMQDHYRIILGDYDIEISHNIHPENNQDFYTMIFNNIKQIEEGAAQKAILAYIHLSHEQFKKFKYEADTQIDKKQKEEEERRFDQALAPIDDYLSSLEVNHLSKSK